jgi:hypothetical protein
MMFGLEDQKKKKMEPFVFDLEKELKDPKKHRELKQKVEARIQQIKTILKSGESKEEFDMLGVLLHGYTSLLKVMARCLTTK